MMSYISVETKFSFGNHSKSHDKPSKFLQRIGDETRRMED